MATRGVAGSRREHVLLAADGFLFSAAVDIAATAVMMGTLVLFFGTPAGISDAMGPVWGSVLSLLVTLLAVFGGSTLTWWLHGRVLDWPMAGGMLAGAAVGMAIAMPLFIGAASLLSRISVGSREGPPWMAIGLLAALAVAAVAWPLIDAIRDSSAGRRHHVRLDIARGIAFAVVVLLAGIALPVMGAVQNSEVGEAGIFMVPFAAAGAFAIVGADAIEALRRRRASSRSGVAAG